MDTPLLLWGFIERARRLYPERTVVSRTRTGTDRVTYAELAHRSKRLAAALRSLGIEGGDRVATFAWNHHRHLEAYTAIPGMGAVCHTLNVRLFADQLAYIVRHAEDRVVLIDAELVDMWLPFADRVPSVEAYVVMGEGGEALRETGLPVHDYEELLAGADPIGEWPTFPESRAAFMCYTSGTTGDPKGVVHSHRAMYLHTLVHGLTDVHGIREADVVMPIVPMFHANAWGIPLSATMVGASMVLPGPAPSPSDIVHLMREEEVTFAAAVPTVWQGVLEVATPDDLRSLRRIGCGGSAVPPAMISAYEERFGVPIQQGYGMTETGPLASRAHVKSHLERTLPPPELLELRASQGLLVPGLDMRVVDHAGAEVPWDGRTPGEIRLRGPWIASGYYGEEPFPDGWLHTGDVAVVHPEGYIRIVDRTKDLVKSGGEWISSVELENTIMAHPDVAEAAVVGVPHPRWQERPVAFVVARPGAALSEEGVLDHLRPRVARWWLPDRVEFVSEIPKTSVGKFDKKTLRARLS